MKKALVSSLFLGVLTFNLEAMANVDGTPDDNACIQRAQWVDPSSKTILNGPDLIEKASKFDVVLLGEQHGTAPHHRWQLQSLTQLYTHNPNMILGFEMFPRRVQDVLDSWVRGELSREAFLKESDWDDVWGYNPDLYMPLFEFARMNRLPMIALNVERELIRDVGSKGWDNVDEEVKEGVLKPRDALPEYRDFLSNIYRHHPTNEGEEISAQEKEKRFNHFVEAQLTWDGAMAQKIANMRQKGGRPLVVAVMGSGHLRFGHGVPHQLEGLGVQSKILMPWTVGRPCSGLKENLAHAVFGVDADRPETDKFRPVLGVRITLNEDQEGVLIEQIVEESVAEDAGLMENDLIKRVAGLQTLTTQDVIAIVRRQAPGTWLPLEVEREGNTIEIIAKFPSFPLD